MRGININAVLFGATLVLVLNLLLAQPLRLILRLEMFGPDATVAVVLTASVVLGVLTGAAGGYLSARQSGRQPYLNAGAVGVINMAVGALFLDGAFPLLFNLLSFAVMVPAALIGGDLARGQQVRAMLEAELMP